MNQPVIKLTVGLIAHRQIQPGLLVHDTFVMGKCIKSGFPVVSAHAALTEAAEAHLACGKVDDGIIDASAAEAAQRGYFLTALLSEVNR